MIFFAAVPYFCCCYTGILTHLRAAYRTFGCFTVHLLLLCYVDLRHPCAIQFEFWALCTSLSKHLINHFQTVCPRRQVEGGSKPVGILPLEKTLSFFHSSHCPHLCRMFRYRSGMINAIQPEYACRLRSSATSQMHFKTLYEKFQNYLFTQKTTAACFLSPSCLAADANSPSQGKW